MKPFILIACLFLLLPVAVFSQEKTTIVLNQVAPHIPVITTAPESDSKREKLEAQVREWAKAYPDEFVAMWEQAVIATEKGNSLALAIEKGGKLLDASLAYNFINWEEGFDIRTPKWAELTERMNKARTKMQNTKGQVTESKH